MIDLKPCPFVQIPLTKGKFAKVDLEDYAELIKYSWYATSAKNGNYAARDRTVTGRKIHIYMHRQILNALDTCEYEVDHINGDPLDNRKENLRLVEHKNNQKNQTTQQGTSSKFKGVYWSDKEKSWSVQIKENGRCRTVRGVESEEIAGIIYDLLALDRFKEFARFNNSNFISQWNTRAEPIGNSDELPEWVKKELIDAVVCAKDDETKGWNDAIGYVLSLKKPEDE